MPHIPEEARNKWGFPIIRGTLSGVLMGPYKKDYRILGSILGSPYFGKLTNLDALMKSFLRPTICGVATCFRWKFNLNTACSSEVADHSSPTRFWPFVRWE